MRYELIIYWSKDDNSFIVEEVWPSAMQPGNSGTGGPVGWSDNPWSAKFVEWLRRFGFTRDPRFAKQLRDDRPAFNVRRQPSPRPIRR